MFFFGFMPPLRLKYQLLLELNKHGLRVLRSRQDAP